MAAKFYKLIDDKQKADTSFFIPTKFGNIMKAKRKPLDVKAAADFGVSLDSNVKVLKVTPPPQREGGIKVADVAELVDKLKNEAKVIS